MTVFGIRCSTTDFSFAIVTGQKTSPRIEHCELIVYPKGYSRPQRLKWFAQELQEVTRNRGIQEWIIKGAEPSAKRGKPFVERVEFEAITMLVAAENGIDQVPRKVKSTIAKDLGLPGRPQALNEFDYSLIPGFHEQPEKIREAILVAWSALQ